MNTLQEYLHLQRCPHCGIDHPNLSSILEEFKSTNSMGRDEKKWRFFQCQRCGNIVVYWFKSRSNIDGFFPEVATLSNSIPSRVKEYLQQAIDSSAAPAGAVMLCASAVDAMLKEKGLAEGTLYTRINKAVTDGLLTHEMSTWAHQVRLDANDQRHADTTVELPTIDEAKQVIEFAKVLAEFLFVLPAKVKCGISSTVGTPPAT